MCLSIPYKVVKIKKRWADIEQNGDISRVNVGLVGNVKVGEYIFAYENFAVSRLCKSDALEIIKMAKKYHSHTH